MENVLLVIHLILALCLIGVVLLQRSEGGMGSLGGGGGGGVVSARAAANALSRLTWILAAAFLASSLALTVIAARKAASTSVVDRAGELPVPGPSSSGAPAPVAPSESLLPPVTPAEPAAPPPVE